MSSLSAANPVEVARTSGRERLYFFWDYDLSEADVRRILAGDDPVDRAWVISRLLNVARWEDIWQYITLDDIRAHWELLRFRTPYLQEAWAHALEVWSREEGWAEAREPRPAYRAEPEPTLWPGILSPLQEALLSRFFSYDIGQHFFLTGGTALAAFYLGHRLSEDLDLFTASERGLDAARDALQDMAERAGWQLDLRRWSPYFLQAIVITEAGESVKVDLVRETGPELGPKRRCAGIVVDSLLDIAANKVTAILSRADAKDFVDLYFVLPLLDYDIEELIELAKQKDPGLTEFFFAAMLRQGHQARRLPVMRQPLDLAALIAFFDGLADRLLARHRPPR
ncbi:MAG: nucleotidyl transferase AbiEii/AbiGii toxin family protein [Anaerolineae bacterium]|nr:nucleotidyl transferase AbiEii/AbiGii toxin family protein [Anaerolineae bacterium]